MTNQLSNTGHGHVKPRADGAIAKCGGPGMCSVCNAELAALQSEVKHVAQAIYASEFADDFPSEGTVDYAMQMQKAHAAIQAVLICLPEMVDRSWARDEAQKAVADWYGIKNPSTVDAGDATEARDEVILAAIKPFAEEAKFKKNGRQADVVGPGYLRKADWKALFDAYEATTKGSAS